MVGLSACEPRVVYKTIPLPLPVRPNLPKITSDDLACVKQDVYEKFVKRELLIRHYCEKLELIIKSTYN